MLNLGLGFVYNATIMLKLLRDKGIQKKIYIGLAVIVTFSFVVSGIIIGQDDRKATSALAKLGKHKISVSEYLNSYRAVQKQAEMMYGDKINELRGLINFKSEAWDRILLLDYAKSERIRVPDKAVVDWITSQEGFKRDGKFNDEFYRMYIERALRSTPRQFEEEIRQMLTLNKVQEKISGDLDLTDEKLKELYLAENTEKDLVYGVLPKESLESQIEASDSSIQQLYDVVKDKLTSPSKANLRYYFIPNESAQNMAEALGDQTTSFNDLAAKYSLAAKETGFFSKNEVLPDLIDAPQVLGFGFSAEPLEVSPWIEAKNGHYRAELLERQPEHTLTLEESKEEIKKMFREQEASSLALKRLNELKTKMKSPADFETVLNEEKIQITPYEKYKKGMYPEGIWPSEELDKAVTDLSVDGISEAFSVPKGAMIVKVVKVISADDKKFEESKKAFKEQIIAQRSQEEMKKLLEKLRDKLTMNLELMKEIFPADSADSSQLAAGS